MDPSRCYLCIQPSVEFPQDFSAVLNDFIRVFHEFQLRNFNCSEETNLVLCRTCWIYFMRVHKLHQQLSFKKDTSDPKILLLSSKIQQTQKSSGEVDSNLPCDNVELQILEREEEGVEVGGQSQDGDSAVVAGCSSSKFHDDSETESLDSCATADSTSTESSAAETEPTTEKEPPGKTCSSESIAVEPTYENKWLPYNLTRLAYSPDVKRLSEVDFMYQDEYPFQGTETGFKCGLCPAICSFYKCLPLWSNMIGHIKKWHKGKGEHRLRANKILQRFVEVAPNRFQYGKYLVDKIGESYRCDECGAMKPAASGTKNKASNIMVHISEKHEKPSKTYVCEYCGIVYRNRNGLRVHKINKHENQNGKFPCQDCGKIFRSSDRVYRHQKQVHRSQQKCICESCGKEFSTKASFENHMACVHKTEKIKCEECGKMFGSQAALYTHGHSHTGKTFSCDICGMDFTQPYSVTRHKKTAHP